MEQVLLLARSMTHAQQMQSVLHSSGIPCRLDRAPLKLSSQGCSMALLIPYHEQSRALPLLCQARMAPLRMFHLQDGNWKEAPL